MSEPALIAATAATTTGVISIPVLGALGIDPPAMISGLLGVVVVQTILADTGLTWRSIVLRTLGSIIFASLATSVVAPMAIAGIEKLGYLVPVVSVRALVAAALGGFAQPVLVRIRTRFISGKQAKVANDA